MKPKHSILILKKLFLFSFIIFLFTNCGSNSTDLSPIVGDYMYVTTKTMGGYEIKGTWKLNITKNGDGDYSYTIVKTINDQMYGGNPKSETSNGKFATTLDNSNDWYLIGYGNAHISIPYGGFKEAPSEITMYGDGDPKLFIRLYANAEPSNSTSLNPTPVNFSDANFNPLNFLMGQSYNLNKILQQMSYDYALIRPINHNKYSQFNNININTIPLGKSSDMSLDCDTYFTDIKNGAPLYEVHLEQIRRRNRFADGGLTRDQVGDGYDYAYYDALVSTNYVLLYTNSSFLAIPAKPESNCDFLMNIYNISSIFKNQSLPNEIDTNEHVLELASQNIDNAKEIPVWQSRWFKSLEKSNPIPDTNSQVETPDTLEQNEYIQTEDNNQTQEQNQNSDTDKEQVYKSGYYITNGSENHKVYFYNAPDNSTRRSAYINSQEEVFIQKVVNGFGYIEFTNDKGDKSIGWLNMNDLILKP